MESPGALNIAIAFIGLGLSIFGIGFNAWSRRLKELIDWARKIEVGQREIQKDFHKHELRIENRITALEARINGARKP